MVLQVSAWPNRCFDTMENISKEKKYLVAIRCTVYNHEPYLHDCLEGFVMQKTNFPFVAIVHDDASTDNSAAIIREYAEKYPDIIKPIFETENQWHKHDGSLQRIMNNAIDATGAKYIAFCEGDDYWTNPYKLQKQVDVLELHPEYSMCYSDYQTVDGAGNLFDWPNHDKHVKVSFTGDNFRNLMKNNYIITASTLYRKDIILNPTLPSSWDYSLFLNAALVGKLCYIPQKTACYRLQPNSVVHIAYELVNSGLNEVWYQFAAHYVITPSVHRGFWEHMMILGTIDANLISKMQINGSDVERAKHFLHAHKLLLLAYPIGFMMRVRNRILKRLRK